MGLSNQLSHVHVNHIQSLAFLVCNTFALSWSLSHIRGAWTAFYDHVCRCVISSDTVWSVMRLNMTGVSFIALLNGRIMITFLPTVIM